jgi:hypothetical protein
MTQKEIWTGYWNSFIKFMVHAIAPVAAIRYVAEWISNKIVDTRRDKVPGIPNYKQAPPPPPMQRPRMQANQQQEIKDILDNMLKERYGR